MIEDTRNRRIKNIMPTIAETLDKQGYERGLRESRSLVRKAQKEKRRAEVEKQKADRKAIYKEM
jgi:hypothetical protein